MYQVLYDVLALEPVAYLASLLILFFFSLLLCFFVRKILIRLVKRMTQKYTKHDWGAVLFQHRFFHRLADVVIPIGLSFFAAGMPQYHNLFGKIVGILGVVVFLLLFDSVLGAIDEIYRRYEASKTRPIKSLLQVIQVAVIIVGGLVGIAILTGINLSVLLGGIGAATAITSLIFKDSILGFVAGIQLIANDMIRIGDWIEMPAQSADGTVIDLSMTTVKVENFDKTITSIPAYTLVSSAFINWRGMETSGARRIKRAIYIDIAGVRICDEEMLSRFRRMELIRDYVDQRTEEISRYHQEHHTDLQEVVNGRRMTNIGTFRAYITAYLANHPGIRKDMTRIVRQLAPCDQGVPIEIYAFTNTVQWEKYESIQGDIFDHLLAVIGEFGLQAYQRPSSSDVRAISLVAQNNKP